MSEDSSEETSSSSVEILGRYNPECSPTWADDETVAILSSQDAGQPGDDWSIMAQQEVELESETDPMLRQGEVLHCVARLRLKDMELCRSTGSCKAEDQAASQVQSESGSTAAEKGS